jgi:hypothetical protein
MMMLVVVVVDDDDDKKDSKKVPRGFQLGGYTIQALPRQNEGPFWMDPAQMTSFWQGTA